jgi:D-glycero-alpha-D-manno-heptose-7-phosphate kinase
VDDPLTAHASAPVRLDFAGGWTDVEPFASEQGGVVVNAALELRATASITPADAYELRSDDLGQVLHPRTPADFEKNGELDLLKAAVRMTGIGPCRIRTASAAPPGSGLGSSGALDVALVAALDASAGTVSDAVDVAERAWRLEAVEAALPGGRQDQYAAALGGFHRLTFGAGGVGVHPLRLNDAVLEALARHIVVCYTGQSRVSSDTIARVMTGFVGGKESVVSSLHGLAAVADRMSEALIAGDLVRIGALLSENWRCQQRLDAGMCTDLMARLDAGIANLGGLGGKAAGAGAGGSMFFVVGDDRVAPARFAESLGVTVIPVQWAREGIRTW